MRNAIQCNGCGETIESTSLHDHKRCRCGQCFVDGGTAYARCGYGDAGYTDLCEFMAANDDASTVADAVDSAMSQYLERYARDPDGLSAEELEAVHLWLLGKAKTN